MSQTQTTLVGEHSVEGRVLHVAFELSESKWVLAFSDGRTPAAKARIVTIPSRDLERLGSEIVKAKTRFELAEQCRVVSCYEAGRDGFWLHRHLESIGVENLLVDSASIEVNRRKRRAKTDRLDARKLLAMLIRHQLGERDVWSVVRVPSVEDEDARQLHRELEQLKREVLQHRLRINSLLVAQGIKLCVGNNFLAQLGNARLHDGSPVPAGLQARLQREYQRLGCVQAQLREVDKARSKLVRAGSAERLEKVRRLQSLRGIGLNGSWLLVMEFFGWRQFNNGKEVGGAGGLTGCPYDNGNSDHEQGISKTGNHRVRWMMVQLAWCWLRFQPDSKASQWFHQKWGHGSKRQRKVGIVALARRLLVDLWRFVEFGVVPDRALLQS
jgi:transposase